MAWLQYDWRTRKELCTAGAAEWGRQDPWKLLTCIPHNSAVQDPFDVTPQDLRLRQPLATQSVTSHGKAEGPSQSNNKGMPTHREGLCRLFNRAPAGCPYGEKCIFTHRCTLCKKADHGRRRCPKGEGGGSNYTPKQELGDSRQ